MDRRTLVAIFLILGVLLIDSIWWSSRTRHKAPATPPAASQTAPGAKGDSGAALGAGAGNVGGSNMATQVEGAPTVAGEQIVASHVADAPVEERVIKGDTFEATFSTVGGSITSWKVPAYKNPTNKAPVDLVRPDTRALQVVVSTGQATYDFSRVPFHISWFDATAGKIQFTARDSTGVEVVKTYALNRDRKLMDVDVRIASPVGRGPLRYRIGWGPPLPFTELYSRPTDLHGMALVGDQLFSLDTRGLGKERLKTEKGNVRWVGNRSKYFLAALVPDSLTVDEVAFLPTADNSAGAWITGASAPGATVERHMRLYGGPLHFDTLLALGSNLEQAVNLGWRWLHPVTTFLLKSLFWLHTIIPNYGVGIILLSLATKIVFYPLSQSSLRTMKVMHRLQPRMNEIREKYKDDPVKMNNAVMALYKDHKVNPLGGCLPMLLQVPVFLALYQVLLYSVELRAAGFVGHIHDLSAPDLLMTIGPLPIHVLPILMTLSTVWMQSLTPTDPQQRPLMMLMPVMMLFFMYNLPSGVILYWTVNNVFSALQQMWVNIADDRQMAAAGAQ